MSSEEAKKKKPAGAETAKKTTTQETPKKPVTEEAPKKAATTPAPRKPAPEEAAKKKKKKAVRVSSYYKTADGTLQRKLRSCPRCGPGTFLAEHYDRISCGKCGYAEFKRQNK
jgi:small subunit ribosomal protein S27Ae